MIRIYLEEDHAAMSRRAAHIIAAEIHRDPSCVLGLATGSTPIETYKNLIEWNKAGDLSFADVTTVNLDEYKGLAPDHDQSYRYFMNTNLFNSVNIDKARTFVPDGLEPDSAKACADYNKIIADCGQVDLQLLGLGLNGHIGFNEPSDSFEKETHCVDLTESTIQANSRFFESIDMVPTQAYTMGIQTIMRAKKIVLVVNGEGKAQIVKDAFFGPITPNVPASILQLHDDVVIVGDAGAFSLIKDLI